MKKTTILFEISEQKTIVTATGKSGSSEVFDITGTEVEKDFSKLLKKLREDQLVKETLKAIDINTSQEG